MVKCNEDCLYLSACVTSIASNPIGFSCLTRANVGVTSVESTRKEHKRLPGNAASFTTHPSCPLGCNSTRISYDRTMVLAWYRDAVEDNNDQPHKTSPPQYVNIETLNKTTHMLYWKLDADNYLKEGKFQKIREERFYDYEDVCEMHPDKMPKLEEWKKTFYREHLHSDEEIRFILDGSGYWDVRDENDRWIRVMGEKGDLIVVPAGMYHRFCLDEKNYIKAIRLFQGSPDWTAFFRPSDDHPARIAYLKQLSKK